MFTVKRVAAKFGGLVLVLLMLAVGINALPPESRPAAIQSAANVDNDTYINANKILMFVTNHGNFGRDLAGVFGNDYGTYYPYTSIWDIASGGSISSPLYAGGLWLGGIDQATGDTLVAVSEYSSEYVPGPMVNGTYQLDRPEFRVYKLYRDSLANHPNQDYLQWPVMQGAPVDGNGDPAIIGDQFLWAVYNDADPQQHDNNSGSTMPLGTEVQHSIFAWQRYSGPLASTVFFRFKVVNKGGKTLNNFFISLWFDPDLGGAGDDLVGCDTLDNRFFCYNADNDDSQYGAQPPAIGFKILEGPIVPSLGDTALVDGLPRPNYKNLGMYSFNKYINGTDPDDYAESYCYMRGLDAKNGCISYINPTNGQPTRFVMSGDPVAGTGWRDDSPSDRRMMASFGPFTFRPSDTQQVLFKMAVGQGADRLSSITVLRDILEYESDVTDVSDPGSSLLPREFSVRQNYPNPFNPATTIRYSLPERAEVEVAVFNVLGQKVATLQSGTQSVGEHTVVWNGTDDAGRPVASGVYLYRVRAGDEIQTRKMMMLK